jgi:hypothetical protein
MVYGLSYLCVISSCTTYVFGEYVVRCFVFCHVSIFVVYVEYIRILYFHEDVTNVLLFTLINYKALEL